MLPTRLWHLAMVLFTLGTFAIAGCGDKKEGGGDGKPGEEINSPPKGSFPVSLPENPDIAMTPHVCVFVAKVEGGYFANVKLGDKIKIKGKCSGRYDKANNDNRRYR